MVKEKDTGDIFLNGYLFLESWEIFTVRTVRASKDDIHGVWSGDGSKSFKLSNLSLWDICSFKLRFSVPVSLVVKVSSISWNLSSLITQAFVIFIVLSFFNCGNGTENFQARYIFFT